MRISPTISKMRPKGRVRLDRVDADRNANIHVVMLVKF